MQNLVVDSAFGHDGHDWKRLTRRSVILGSFFLLLVLKIVFTQIIFEGKYPTSLAVVSEKGDMSNPIEKEIRAMDEINKKLAALSFGAPVPISFGECGKHFAINFSESDSFR